VAQKGHHTSNKKSAHFKQKVNILQTKGQHISNKNTNAASKKLACCKQKSKWLRAHISGIVQVVQGGGEGRNSMNSGLTHFLIKENYHVSSASIFKLKLERQNGMREATKTTTKWLKFTYRN